MRSPRKESKKPLPKLIVFDFDGVLTDNRVLVFSDGTEAVMCSRSDGMAFDMFRAAHIRTLILSTEKNSVVQARAQKLKTEVLQGTADKAAALRDYCRRARIKLEEVFFVGNDVNDLSVISIVGKSFCPADAHTQVKAAASSILRTSGGSGVARELAEKVLGLAWNGST
ncbi:MAG: HAD hydrolase family protein [Oligoflexia bacterium]|nr:HAD hydrolase family protein [Oligoflexia bacterium]